MKVSYWDDGGFSSKAYLDDDPLPDGSFVGTNKYSDFPVHVRWNGTLDRWVEVCHRQWNCLNPYTDVWEEIDPQPCACRAEEGSSA